MFEPIGHVLVNKEFKFTELWPDPQPTMRGMLDLEKNYKQALAGTLVKVMKILENEDGYLVLGEPDVYEPFLWMIDVRDTRTGSFIPVIMKQGIPMPGGLSPMEEFEFIASMMKK